MNEPTLIRARTHPTALISFLLGLSSVCLLLIVTGLPAILLGLRGLRAVNASDGRLRGARLAIAGMVLGGIGTLITLLGGGAILALRLADTNARVECSNHLREIGIAANKYADVRGTFPPATHTPEALPPERRLSWLADILPLASEGTAAGARYRQLTGKIDRTRPWDAPVNRPVADSLIGLFLCPGHRVTDPGRGPGRTDYVGVAGLGDDAAYLKREDPRAGMFGHDRGVRREEVVEGISFTFLVLETGQENGPWLAGGFPTVRGVPEEEPVLTGPGRPFGGLHHRLINILYVDGSVRPVSDDTSAKVFRAQATLRRQRP